MGAGSVQVRWQSFIRWSINVFWLMFTMNHSDMKDSERLKLFLPDREACSSQEMNLSNIMAVNLDVNQKHFLSI